MPMPVVTDMPEGVITLEFPDVVAMHGYMSREFPTSIHLTCIVADLPARLFVDIASRFLDVPICGIIIAKHGDPSCLGHCVSVIPQADADASVTVERCLSIRGAIRACEGIAANIQQAGLA